MDLGSKQLLVCAKFKKKWCIQNARFFFKKNGTKRITFDSYNPNNKKDWKKHKDWTFESFQLQRGELDAIGRLKLVKKEAKRLRRRHERFPWTLLIGARIVCLPLHLLLRLGSVLSKGSPFSALELASWRNLHTAIRRAAPLGCRRRGVSPRLGHCNGVGGGSGRRGRERDELSPASGGQRLDKRRLQLTYWSFPWSTNYYTLIFLSNNIL